MGERNPDKNQHERKTYFELGKLEKCHRKKYKYIIPTKRGGCKGGRNISKNEKYRIESKGLPLVIRDDGKTRHEF